MLSGRNLGLLSERGKTMAQIFGTHEQLKGLLEAVTAALASAELSLSRLNSFPMDNEAIKQSCQQMRVIGRAASMMEWPQLAALAHGTEGILKDVLDGVTRLDLPQMTHIQSSLGTMTLLLQCLQSPERPATWPPSLDGTGSVVVAAQDSLWHAGNDEPGGAGERGSPPPDKDTNESDQRKEEGRTTDVSQRRPSQIEARPLEEMIARSLQVIVRLQQQRQSGVLHLKRGSAFSAEEGWIRFSEGRMTEAQTGRRKGSEARNWLSTWGPCRFAFHPDDQQH